METTANEYQPLEADWDKIKSGEQLPTGYDSFSEIDLSRSMMHARAANVAHTVLTSPDVSDEERENAEMDFNEHLDLSNKSNIMGANWSPYARNTPEWRNLRRNLTHGGLFGGSEEPILGARFRPGQLEQLQRDPEELAREAEDERATARVMDAIDKGWH